MLLAQQAQAQLSLPKGLGADFTILTPFPQLARRLLGGDEADGNDSRKSFAQSVDISGELGRALACSCFAGRAFSFTVRHKGTQNHQSKKLWAETGYAASNTWQPGNLNTLEEICRTVYDEIFGPQIR
jgi:hypothetical protein